MARAAGEGAEAFEGATEGEERRQRTSSVDSSRTRISASSGPSTLALSSMSSALMMMGAAEAEAEEEDADPRSARSNARARADEVSPGCPTSPPPAVTSNPPCSPPDPTPRALPPWKGADRGGLGEVKDALGDSRDRSARFCRASFAPMGVGAYRGSLSAEGIVASASGRCARRREGAGGSEREGEDDDEDEDEEDEEGEWREAVATDRASAAVRVR